MAFKAASKDAGVSAVGLRCKGEALHCVLRVCVLTPRSPTAAMITMQENPPHTRVTITHLAGVLQLKLLGATLDCPTNATLDLAQALPTRFKSGSIGPCPDNEAVCGSLACAPSCAVGGVCSEGACYCNLQFTGAWGRCGGLLRSLGSGAAAIPACSC